MITGDEPINGILSYTRSEPYEHIDLHQSGGLTIRQHFAAMAMQGLIGAKPPEGFFAKQKILEIIELSVIMADILITELNKKQ